MNVNPSIQAKVQQTLRERGEEREVVEPGQAGWKDFLAWLQAKHPDLWETLLIEGLQYPTLTSPHQQEQRKTQGRARRRHLANLLTREVDDLTGEWVLSRPKLWAWGTLGVMLICTGLLWASVLNKPAKTSVQTASVAPVQELPEPTPLTQPAPVPKPPVAAAVTPTNPPTPPSKPPPPVQRSEPRPLPEPPTPTLVYPTSSPLPRPTPIPIAQPRPILPTFVPPPEPPRLTTPTTTARFKASPVQPELGDDFVLYTLVSSSPGPTQNTSPASESAQDDTFYLSNAQASTPALQVGQFYQGQLASDLILTEGGKMTAVVLSGTSVWQGEASLGASGRIELRFSQLSVGGQSYALSAVGYGLKGGRRVPGLSAQFRDQAPALTADALRGALRGVARYVDLSNQGGSSTVTGGVVLNQPNPPDLLANVAGSLAELLAVPAGERALVRIAAVPQGTPVQLLVLSLGEPSR